MGLQIKGLPLIFLQCHGKGRGQVEAGSVSVLAFPRTRRPLYSRTALELQEGEGRRKGGSEGLSPLFYVGDDC